VQIAARHVLRVASGSAAVGAGGAPAVLARGALAFEYRDAGLARVD